MIESKKFLVSWWHHSDFSYFYTDFKVWTTGKLFNDAELVCAAMRVKDEDHAVRKVYSAYDVMPSKIEFKRIEEKPLDWNPFDEEDF